MHFTVQTSPTFKRLQSTARWGEEKDSMVLGQEPGMKTMPAGRFAYSSQEQTSKQIEHKYSTLNAIVSGEDGVIVMNSRLEQNQTSENFRRIFADIIFKETELDRA